MIDPHITGSYGGYDEGFGGEGGMDFRANRLYESLEKAGRYAELDKAKRNEHYRAYLLENFDDSEDEYY